MASPIASNAADARPPYDAAAQYWDLVLRSSDNVDFHVNSQFLSYSSPVFRDMLASPQPPPCEGEAEANADWKDGCPIVRLAEKKHVLRPLLGFVYPGDAPSIGGLEQVSEVIEAARKYQMVDVSARVRRALIAEDFLETAPLRVFTIAYLFRFESEARIAAFYMLRNPMIGSKLTNGAYPSLGSLRKLDGATDDKKIIAAAQKIRAGAAGEGRRPFRIVKPEPSTVMELERIPAATLQRLQQYYIDCEQAARAVAESKDWLKDTNAAWLSCTVCAGKVGEDDVPKPGLTPGPAHWWQSYMLNTANAFMTAPCPETVTKPYLIQEMYRQAGACKNCRKRVFTAMPDFCKSYAEAVEKAIRKVVLDLHM